MRRAVGDVDSILQPAMAKFEASGSGYGSSATTVRRLGAVSSTSTNPPLISSDITVADDSTNATTFTVSRDGVYYVQYQDGESGADAYRAITFNASGSDLTTSPEAIDPSTWIGCFYQSAIPQGMGFVVKLKAGDVLRGQMRTGLTPGNNDGFGFTLVRIF
jgi:hypothetical protein